MLLGGPRTSICRVKNKASRKEYNKEWRKRNPEAARDHGLKTRHGLDREDLRVWYVAQNGRCAACGEPIDFKDVCVDHCHTTEKRRGLVHIKCNTGLAMAADSPAKLHAWASYLERQGHAPDGTPRFKRTV